MSAMQTSGPKLSNSREIRSLVGSVTRGSMLIDFILDDQEFNVGTPGRPGDEPRVAAESATTLKYMVVASLQKTPFHAFRSRT